MAKNPSQDKKKVLRRGGWSPEEDQKLMAYICRYGIWNWNETPKHAGLSRTGKSCRLRWLNYLRPGIKRGNISREEEEIIVKLQKIMGNRWSAIAAQLPQRTDNEIKNFWNTRMKKQLMKKEFSSKTTESSSAESGDNCVACESDSSSIILEESPQSTTYDMIRPFSSSTTTEAAVLDIKDHYVGLSGTSNEGQTVMLSGEGSETEEKYSDLSHLLYDDDDDSYYVPSYDFWASPFF